ncbi:MAG: sugar-binding protein, partial [Candidatus Poribacteria bacterium]
PFDDNAEIGFRNNQITIYPIKIIPISSIEIDKSTSAISVDGKIDEKAWSKAIQLNDYVTVQGDRRPKNQLATKIAFDENSIYISADIRGNPEKIKQITNSTVLERDNRNIIRNESFNINLSDGEIVYNFAINPQGSQFDAKSGDEKWNFEWIGKVSITDAGWIAEMSIPMSFFGDDLSKKQWYIDFVRLDSSENEVTVLVPTFSITDRENRLPEYSESVKDHKLLPKLVLKI